jgi:hypothetical protein
MNLLWFSIVAARSNWTFSEAAMIQWLNARKRKSLLPMMMKKIAFGIFGLVCLVSPLVPAASAQVVVAVGHPHHYHHYHHQHCYYRHGHRHCYYR